MTEHDHLIAMLNRLKLTVLRDQLDSLIDEAGRRELTIREALALFFKREIARRNQRRIDMGFGLAGFDCAVHPYTTKTPALIIIQLLSGRKPGTTAGEAHAAVVADLSINEAERVLETAVDPDAHLMSDKWQAFITVDGAFRAHDTVPHSQREYVRGMRACQLDQGFQ